MMRRRVLSIIQEGGYHTAEEIRQVIVDRMVSNVTVEGVRFALNCLMAMGRVDKYIVDDRTVYSAAEAPDED